MATESNFLSRMFSRPNTAVQESAEQPAQAENRDVTHEIAHLRVQLDGIVQEIAAQQPSQGSIIDQFRAMRAEDLLEQSTPEARRLMQEMRANDPQVEDRLRKLVSINERIARFEQGNETTLDRARVAIGRRFAEAGRLGANLGQMLGRPLESLRRMALRTHDRLDRAGVAVVGAREALQERGGQMTTDAIQRAREAATQVGSRSREVASQVVERVQEELSASPEARKARRKRPLEARLSEVNAKIAALNVEQHAVYEALNLAEIRQADRDTESVEYKKYEALGETINDLLPERHYLEIQLRVTEAQVDLEIAQEENAHPEIVQAAQARVDALNNDAAQWEKLMQVTEPVESRTDRLRKKVRETISTEGKLVGKDVRAIAEELKKNRAVAQEQAAWFIAQMLAGAILGVPGSAASTGMGALREAYRVWKSEDTAALYVSIVGADQVQGDFIREPVSVHFPDDQTMITEMMADPKVQQKMESKLGQLLVKAGKVGLAPLALLQRGINWVDSKLLSADGLEKRFAVMAKEAESSGVSLQSSEQTEAQGAEKLDQIQAQFENWLRTRLDFANLASQLENDPNAEAVTARLMELSGMIKDIWLLQAQGFAFARGFREADFNRGFTAPDVVSRWHSAILKVVREVLVVVEPKSEAFNDTNKRLLEFMVNLTLSTSAVVEGQRNAQNRTKTKILGVRILRLIGQGVAGAALSEVRHRLEAAAQPHAMGTHVDARENLAQTLKPEQPAQPTPVVEVTPVATAPHSVNGVDDLRATAEFHSTSGASTAREAFTTPVNSVQELKGAPQGLDGAAPGAARTVATPDALHIANRRDLGPSFDEIARTEPQGLSGRLNDIRVETVAGAVDPLTAQAENALKNVSLATNTTLSANASAEFGSAFNATLEKAREGVVDVLKHNVRADGLIVNGDIRSLVESGHLTAPEGAILQAGIVGSGYDAAAANQFVQNVVNQ